MLVALRPALAPMLATLQQAAPDRLAATAALATTRQDGQLIEAIRTLEDGLRRVKAAASNRSAPWQTEVGRMTRQLAQLAGDPTTRSGHDAILALSADLAQLPPPTPTGLSRLDEFLQGGLRPGIFHALGGAAKVGKTIITATLSGNLDRQGIPHLVAALDSSDEEFAQLKVARHLNQPATRLHHAGNQARSKLADIARTARGCYLFHAPGKASRRSVPRHGTNARNTISGS